MPISRARSLRVLSSGSLLTLACLTLCVALASAASPARAQQASPTPPPPNTGLDFYGINFIAPYQPWLSLGFNSGARMVRWQFNWRDIEPSPGGFTWDKTDQQVAAWNKAGLEIHAILHNPPDYIIASGLVPNNLTASYTSSDASFARYCYQFASRYQGRIASYEVWNEPDLTQYWGGTAQQYYLLLKGCYLGIKAADPGVTVLMAGMAYTTNHGFTVDVIRAAAGDPEGAAHNHFFDVMAFHSYGDPEWVYSHTLEIRDILKRYDMGDKPIWITESNVPLRGVGGVPDIAARGMASPEEGGWYVLQAASNALAAGAQKLMFFRLADDDMKGDAWGLVGNSGTPRPGYKALQLASSVMREITEAKREVRDGVVITTMRRLDGGRVVTIYAPDGQAKQITVQAEYAAATLINSAGGYSPLVADGQGLYHVTVPPATGRDPDAPYNYVVGGPVMLLVEFDRDPPDASLEVVALPDDPQHVLIKWRGDDGRFGTGVASYDVQANDNGAGWLPLKINTTDTQLIFDISKGGEFGFRVRATDRVGNVGSFSEPVAATLRIIGTIMARVIDLRGQAVSAARITLADGSLHDTDADGWARIEVAPGAVQVQSVDGGAQGAAGQQPPLDVALAEEKTITIKLEPRNLLANGAFDRDASGWTVTSLLDVTQVITNGATGQGVLRLSGQRRPWGPPAAEIGVAVPADNTAAILSFEYHLSDGGQTLRVRAIGGQDQQTIWQSGTPNTELSRVWLDVGQLAGQTVTLRFELWGPKGAPVGFADIDDVIVGNVPVISP